MRWASALRARASWVRFSFFSCPRSCPPASGGPRFARDPRERKRRGPGGVGRGRATVRNASSAAFSPFSPFFFLSHVPARFCPFFGQKCKSVRGAVGDVIAPGQRGLRGVLLTDSLS